MGWWVLGAIVYAVCGVLAYGMTNYYFQMRWPGLSHRPERGLCWFLALSGPLGLIIAACSSIGYYGLMYRHDCERMVARHYDRGGKYTPDCITRRNWA